MAISKYGTKLLLWLERYNITADQLIARIPIVKQRGTIMKQALTELAAKELDAPATFTSSAITETGVTLAWAAVTNATGYWVERALNKEFTSSLTTVYTNSSLTYSDTGLSANKKYFYRVSATAGGDYTDEAPNNYATLNITTLAALAAPATFALSAISDTGLTATWSAVTSATGYVLERSTAADFSANLATVYTGANLTANDTGRTPGTHYYYRVHATAAGHTAITYAKADGTTLTALAAPTGFATGTVTATSAVLNWGAVTGATGYVVERATDAGFTANLTTVYTGANLTTTNTGLTTATHYYYRIHATAANHNTITYASLNFTTP